MWESTGRTDNGDYFPSQQFHDLSAPDHVIDLQLYRGLSTLEKATGPLSTNLFRDNPSSSTLDSCSSGDNRRISIDSTLNLGIDFGSFNELYRALSNSALNSYLHTCVASDACVRCRSTAFTLDNLSACVCEDPSNCPHERRQRKRRHHAQCSSYPEKMSDNDQRLLPDHGVGQIPNTDYTPFEERNQNLKISNDEDSMGSNYSSTSSSSTSSSSSSSSSSTSSSSTSSFPTFNLMDCSEPSDSSTLTATDNVVCPMEIKHSNDDKIMYPMGIQERRRSKVSVANSVCSSSI